MEGGEEDRGTTLWLAAVAACDVLILLGIVGLRLNYVLAPGFSFVQRKIGAGL